MARSRQIRVAPSFERQLAKAKKFEEQKKRKKLSMAEFTRGIKI